MIDHQIYSAIAQFARSKKIPDELIRYFDQDGRWVGDRQNWRRSTVAKAKAGMRDAMLPSRRRTSRKRDGLHLLTSFDWTQSTPIQINYSAIAGSVLVCDSKKVNLRAPNLRTIGGDLLTCSDGNMHLPWLSEVGGDLDCRSTFELHAPRLKHVRGNLTVFQLTLPVLESVGKTLRIFWLHDSIAPRLQRVGRSLIGNTGSSFEAPELRTVGRNLTLRRIDDTISLPLLKEIGRSFRASRATIIRANQLKRVGKNIDSSAAEDFFRASLVVGGTWNAHPTAIRDWNLRQAAKRALRNQPWIDI
jgi:hypothetical protein